MAVGLTEDEELELLELEEEEYQASKVKAPSAPKTSALEAGARGFVQGIPLVGTYADEITGGLESLVTDKPYKQARDESRAAYRQAYEDQPASYIGGQLAPSLAVAGIKAIPVAGTALSGAIGAVEGLGASENEDIGGMLSDAALAGGISAGTAGLGKLAMNKLGKAAPKIAENIGQGLEDTAERQAARAMGLERATQKRLGDTAVKSVGRQGIEKGVLTLGASTDDMIGRNKALKDAAMTSRQELYDLVDEAGIEAFNPKIAFQRVADKLEPTYRTPINKSEWKVLDDLYETFAIRGDRNLPLNEAQRLKEEIGQVAFPGGKKPIPGMETAKQRMAMDAYGIVRDYIDEATEAGVNATNNPQLVGKLAESNKLYSVAKNTDKLLENKAAREQGNKLFGLTDTIIGGAGLGYGGMTGDWQTGLGILGAKKVGEKFGPSALAFSADKLADIVRKTPQALGKYRPAFEKAMQRGGNALGVTDFILQQNDPEYREMKKRMNGEEEN